MTGVKIYTTDGDYSKKELASIEDMLKKRKIDYSIIQNSGIMSEGYHPIVVFGNGEQFEGCTPTLMRHLDSLI